MNTPESQATRTALYIAGAAFLVVGILNAHLALFVSRKFPFGFISITIQVLFMLALLPVVKRAPNSLWLGCALSINTCQVLILLGLLFAEKKLTVAGIYNVFLLAVGLYQTIAWISRKRL